MSRRRHGGGGSVGHGGAAAEGSVGGGVDGSGGLEGCGGGSVGGDGDGRRWWATALEVMAGGGALGQRRGR